jgi:hypothetical protein
MTKTTIQEGADKVVQKGGKHLLDGLMVSFEHLKSADRTLPKNCLLGDLGGQTTARRACMTKQGIGDFLIACI